MDSLRLPSYAKINLGLRIIGRRGDGYHDIETLLQQIDLHDEIEIRVTAAPEITYACNRTDLPVGSANLCTRAALLLQKCLGVRGGAEIFLHKIIPVGAGLGGGSSNAAVVLLGLNQLWQLNLSQQRLMELGSELGSDVPFFIGGGTALAEARGEKLTPCDVYFDLPMVVVYPNVNIATAWAYQQVNLDLTKNKKYIKLAHFKNRNFNNVEFDRYFQNDFEEIVFKHYPNLSEIKKRLREKQAIYTSLSGSGSSIYGIFRDWKWAKEAKQFFEKQYMTFIVQPIRWGYEQLNQR